MADEWLFDSIVQFLRSPWWTFPVQTHIDENCIYFEGSEESTLKQSEVHQGFREIVDQVLSTHLEELGVNPSQFIAACDQGKNKELYALVSEYILALDDFVIFKKMMEKRNVELELEALKCLKLGISLEPDVHQRPDDASAALRKRREEEERAQLEAAIAESIQVIDIYKKQLEMEEAQLEHALAISLALEEENRRKAEEATEKLAKAEAEAEKKRINEAHAKSVEALKASYQTEKADIVHRKKASIQSSSETTASAKCMSAPVTKKDDKAAPEMTPTLGNVKLGHLGNAIFQKAPLPGIVGGAAQAKPAPKAAAPAASASAADPASKQPDPDELAKRAEYMKQQRQKLLAMKKQERTKELEEFEKTQAEKNTAPAPAKEADKQQQEMRQALTRRFKEDLIHESKQAALRSNQ